jgi:hypothetical protein
VPPCQISDAATLYMLILSRLEEVAPSIDIPYFSSPELQLRELAPTFERIRSCDGLAHAAKEIFSFAATGKERAKLVSFTLPSLLRLCSVEKKRHLLALSLKEPQRNLRKRLAYGVLRSAATREELFELLTPVRARQLTECGSRKLTELIAKALVLKALAPLDPPSSMWQRSLRENNKKNRCLARARVRELETSARKGLSSLGALDFLAHKPRSKTESRALIPARPLHDARMTLGWILRSAEKFRATPQTSYGRLREFVNDATRRLALERSDGIRLFQSHKLPEKDLWKPQLVERFVAALRLIPESERIMTPNLRDFILTQSSNDAERRQSGRIAFNYPGSLFQWRDPRYEGVSSFLRLVLHEVAHGIQLGHQGRLQKWVQATGEILSPNNPLIDLKGFCEISGWRALGWFDSSHFVGKEGVNLNGQLYPLGRPVTIHFPISPDLGVPQRQERVVLRRGAGNFLYCHDVYAPFSLNSYAFSEPAEDWAEAFTEYIICPDRLINLAPQKFYYMEIHFRLYRSAGDYDRLAAVSKALRSPAGSVAPEPRTHESGANFQS